ncbi:FtsB family cell division protein [Paenibacillus sp. CMAA1364]
MGKYASQTSRQQQSNKYVGGRRRLAIWIGFMVLFLSWAGYTLVNQMSQIADMDTQLVEKGQVQAELDKTVSQLEHEVNRLQDPEYIGQLARKDYGLFRPEETPIRPDVSSP